jgi:uncharacterized protein (TIGR04255 family)
VAKTYNNPPVIEAWIEFHFEYGEEAPEWNKNVAEDFIESIGKSFARKEYLASANVIVNANQRSVEIKHELERIKAYSKENDRCLQTGRTVFVYNMLKKEKEKWPGFPVLLQEVLPLYQQYINKFHPNRIKMITLHYRDHIVIPFENGRIEPKDYFEIYPNMPQDKIGDMVHYSLSLVLSDICKDGITQFSAKTGTFSEEKPQTRLPFTIDWNVHSAISFACDDKTSHEAWLNAAHDGVNKAFEACLTEKCRGLFS